MREDLEWVRPVALLAYLACRPDWHSREAVAQLLRPDATVPVARGYLRRLVHRTAEVFPRLASLEVEEHRLRWAGQSDVADFHSAMEAQDWKLAVELHCAPLLANVASSGLPALDEWFFEERSRLRQSLRAALMAHIADAQNAMAADCSTLMQRLAEDDPLDESGTQFLLTHSRTPLERHVAVTSFHNLVRRLAAEFQQEPLPLTTELFEVIQKSDRSQHVRGRGDSEESVPPAAEPIEEKGREQELRQLTALALDRDARLITIVGFGGTGKTWLARELFTRLRAAKAMQCAWIDLVAADSEQTMLDSVAAQLGVQAHVHSLREHLSTWLAGRHMAIFLDNFEQLIPQTVILEEILARAPAVKFILTSREALRVPSEYCVTLSGLAYQGIDSPAAKLFVHHASRAGRRPMARDRLAVADLVEYLEGLPLAIELAASWSTLLAPEAILVELKRDPQFIDASAEALSTRTMHSVLSAVWRTLGLAERVALGGLASILGTFTIEMARSIALADPAVLLRLISKSMLQRDEAGNFKIHPLVRQFAKSNVDEQLVVQAGNRHSEYFLRAVASEGSLQFGRAISTGAKKLLANAEDIAKAWRRAVEDKRLDLIASSLPSFTVMLLAASRQEDAYESAAFAAERLGGTMLASELSGLQALAALRLGRIDLAVSVANSALTSEPNGKGRALLELCLARVCWFRSTYTAGLQHARTALAAVPSDDPWLRVTVAHDLAQLRYGLDQLDEARSELEESLQLARTYGAQLSEARALCLLGVICTSSAQASQAVQYLQESTRLFRTLGEAYSLGFALRCLGYAYFRLNDPASQTTAAEQSLATFSEAGYEHELGEGLLAVALAHLAGGRAQDSMFAGREGLVRCLQTGNLSGALRCMIVLGILAMSDDRAWGITVTSFAGMHPALRKPDIRVMNDMLISRSVTAQDILEGNQRAARLTLEFVCGKLLGHPLSISASSQQGPAHEDATPDQ